MPSTSDLLIAAYYGTLAVLALFGAHRSLLLFLYFRHRRRIKTPRQSVPLPTVTVQLPLYNERYVATRLLNAVCKLDYPRHLLEIQILDDSDDETTDLLRSEVERWRSQGLDCQHLRRSHRAGFKAGALAAGLAASRGELVAVFDADFMPASDFLKKTVPWFQDPEVAMVQARWDYFNRNYSLLTRMQAILLDGHFRVEHAARFYSQRFFNFNGTAGLWRRRAIEDSGGWQHDTVTEDLDLSYRAQLRGWRFIYLADFGVRSELPVDIAAFKSQQYRWAKGAIQTARKLLPSIFRSTIPWWKKLEAALHLSGNVSALFMTLLSLLVFPAMLSRQGAEQWQLLLIDLPLFMAATGSVVTYYLAAQSVLPERDPSPLRIMPAVLALGIGLSINNARAALAGMTRKGGTFVRTPKYGIEAVGETWQRKSYRSHRDFGFLLEGAFSIYFAVVLATAVRLQMWLSIPFLLLFFGGYSTVFLLTICSRFTPIRRKRFLATAKPT